MNDRLPVSLAYILIYNPTLSLPTATSRDDEDAQEEAHILFYTSRERAVTRDRMLRQVGLAKALVSYSDIFALGQGCDNVHTQTKRMVHVQPEPNYWMHACVDLARTRKPPKDDAKVLKDKQPEVYYHHEDSAHDLALRNSLLEGYEAFKLLHGPFTSVLEKRGPEALRAQLELFFTPWAWRWDLESPLEFGVHLGLQLHPFSSTLAPIVASFFKDVPPNISALLLSPPYLIHPTKLSSKYPPSLPTYLLSLVLPQGLPVSRRTSSKAQNTSKSAQRFMSGSTNSTSGFLSTTGADVGDAINVKKWAWREAFTFGRHKSPQNKPGATGPTKSKSVAEADTPKMMKIGQPPVDISVARVETQVDQQALDDAVLSQNATLSDERLAKVEAEISAESNADSLSRTESQEHDGAITPSPTIVASTPPSDDSFAVFKAFLSESSDPLAVQRRTILFLSKYDLVFAILMNADWREDETDVSLHSLQHSVPGFLRDIRLAIDACHSRPAMSDRKMASNRTRYLIASQHSTVFLSEGFSTSSQFFQCQELLARDTDRIEVFSRTSAAQRWFVARRGLGVNKAGDKSEGEAYLEAANKDASLVDADNEIVGVVRRWIQREE